MTNLTPYRKMITSLSPADRHSIVEHVARLDTVEAMVAKRCDPVQVLRPATEITVPVQPTNAERLTRARVLYAEQTSRKKRQSK